MMIINNPQNIPGKVLDKSELEEISNLAKKYNLLVVRYLFPISLPQTKQLIATKCMSIWCMEKSTNELQHLMGCGKEPSQFRLLERPFPAQVSFGL
jgi:hypothetical protein